MMFGLPKHTRIKMANVAWMLLEQGVSILIAFFVMTLVARQLGPDAFGAYVYLFAISALLMPLAHFGLTEVLVEQAVSRPDERFVIFGSAIVLTGFWALLSMALAVWVVSTFGGPDGVTPALMGLAALQLLVIPVGATWAWFKADERLRPIVFPRICVIVLVAIAAVVMVRYGVGLEAFVGLRAVEQLLLIAAVLAVFAYLGPGLGRLRASRPELLHLLKTGFPLMLSAIAVVVYMRIDQVMLGQMVSQDELGKYGLAVRVSEVALVVPIALGTTFFASIVRAEARGTMNVQRQRLYDLMTLATLGAGLPLAVAVVVLFEPVFGSAYADGIWPTLILLAALPFHGWGIAREKVLLTKRMYWLPPTVGLAGAAINIGLNFALIPLYAGVGAAIATVLTFIATAVGMALVVPALRPDATGMLQSVLLWRSIPRLRRAITEGEQ